MKSKARDVTLAALLAVLALVAGCGGAGAISNAPTEVTPPPVTAPSTAPPASPETAAPPESPEPSAAEPSAAETSEPPVETAPEETMEMIPLTESPAMFIMPTPAAPGTEVLGNEKAQIDVSNKQDGYIMIKFLTKTDKKLVVQIKGPSGAAYQYMLNNTGEYDVFPLSDGNGKYDVGVYQNVDSNRYTVESTASFSVQLTDEFAPFIRPNQYVNYTKDSKAVKKAAELIQNTTGILPKISAVYGFVVENISYDKELAEKITAKVVTNYVPDIDAVLASGKGICFDYASLMTAMLRCQGIPTKLVVGYAGTVYHAWINVYTEETGWIDAVIYFDGAGWKLMDPTFASTSGASDEFKELVGDGNNYQERFLY